MFKKYKQQYLKVLAWNSIARNDILPSLESQIKVCEEEEKEYKTAKNAIEELDAICDVFVTGAMLEFMNNKHPYNEDLYNIFVEGLDRYGDQLPFYCLDEVLRSNDSKFPNEKDVDINVEIYLLEKDTGLKIKTVHNKGKVIFIDENDKIRKPSTYSPPDLEGVITKFYAGEYDNA